MFLRAQIYSSARRGTRAATAIAEAAEAAAAPAAAAASDLGSPVASGAITPRQYALLALKSSLPFVAFGFVDNAIMITAGDAIEASIGVALSLSTMAAAGLGNLCSDVVGIAAGELD